ncbi:MAG: GNAT family N-acetyltransferase [Candidatus Eremiobacteraeota bacterium]|nr:GNAT family N-acetyltransferase [Candidatus Eremiobacteraeota bacterium]
MKKKEAHPIKHIEVRPAEESDRTWMRGVIKARWGEERVVCHGFAYRPAELPAFIAQLNGEKTGLLTYHVDHESVEVITIDSLKPRLGIGSKLLDAVKEYGKTMGCKRYWHVTTNDNLNTLRFYQKRGFVLCALHRNTMDLARKIKPIIPTMGRDGIPLRDELELELVL